MSGWTEATIRAAASWQAFKEGKGLYEAGMVAEAKASATGWQGIVKVGKAADRAHFMSRFLPGVLKKQLLKSINR
jgi:hypothetical protein